MLAALSRRPVQRILWAALLLYSAGHLFQSVFRYFTVTTDFITVWQAVYDWRTTGHYDMNYGFAYPPFYHVIMVPFTFLSDLNASRLALAIDLMALSLAMFTIWTMLPNRWRTPAAAVALIASSANFAPALYTITVHKVEAVETLVVILSMRALSRNHDVRAGFAAGLAASLKLLPAILLPYLLLRKRWKAFLSACLSGLVLTLGSGFVLGFDNLAYHLSLIFREGTGSYIEFYLPAGLNQSLTGLLLRFVAPSYDGVIASLQPLEPGPPVGLGFPWTSTPIDLLGLPYRFTPSPPVYQFVAPPGVNVIVLAVRLAVLAAVAYGLVRLRVRDEGVAILSDLSVVMVVMLLVSPFAQAHYAVFTMPAFGIALVTLMNTRFRGVGQSWLAWTAFGAAYLAVGNFLPLSVAFDHLPKLGNGYQLNNAWRWYSVPTWGYLVLLGLLMSLRAQPLAETAAEHAGLGSSALTSSAAMA